MIKSNKIAHRQLGFTIAVALIFGIVYGATQIILDLQDQRHRVSAEVASAVDSVRRSAGNGLWELNVDLAKSIIEGLVGYSYISSSRITTTSGLELARYHRQVQPEYLRFAADVLFGPVHDEVHKISFVDRGKLVPVGTLIVTVDPWTAFDQFIRRCSITMVGGIVKSILLSVVLHWLFLITTTKPLASLTGQIASVDPVARDTPPISVPPVHERDELGQIARVVNQQVKSIRDTIRRLENAEAELSKTNKTLEDRVRTRTEDLTREIEERISAESKLRIAVETADRLANVRAQFLANMSHDLRTPLNAIIGFSGAIMNSRLSDDPRTVREYLGHIEGAGRDLLALVNDILDLSRIDSGCIQVEYSAFDLNQLVGEIGSLLSPVVEKHQNTWTFSRLEGAATVTSDRVRLKQVLTNLISNAAKFTHDGDIQVTVAGTAGDPSSVSIQVRDTGMGIGPDVLPTIFDRYRQGDAHVVNAEAGSGLGLMIVRSLCDTMEWAIDVTSELGRGTCFTLTIPLVPRPQA